MDPLQNRHVFLYLEQWEASNARSKWNGYAPQYLTELCPRNLQRSLHILRNTSTDLELPLFKTANGQKYFSFRGVKYWNSLSSESKQAVTLHGFKASV